MPEELEVELWSDQSGPMFRLSVTKKRRRELEKASVDRSEAIGHGKHTGPTQKLIASGSSQLQPYLLSQITEHMRTRIPIFWNKSNPLNAQISKTETRVQVPGS